MRLITEKEIEKISIGAGFLGSGGGGNPYLGKLLAIEAVKKFGPVKLIEIGELEKEDSIITACGMGAPSVTIEKLHTLENELIPVKTLERYLNRKINAIISAEVGGLNSMIPIVVASGLGLPLIDADAMGRAFPELQMVTYTLGKIPAVPMSLADEKGNSIIIAESLNNHYTEKIARNISLSMGAIASIALYPSTMEKIRNCIIKDTMTLAEQIGSIISSHNHIEKKIKDICILTGGVEIFRGKVDNILNSVEKGFNKGNVTIKQNNKELKIDFQNEFLAAFINKKVAVTTPDLIVLADAETLEPLTTDSLKYGLRVIVFGIPSNYLWRTPAGLELVGPKYFGYNIEYMPVEKINSKKLF